MVQYVAYQTNVWNGSNIKEHTNASERPCFPTVLEVEAILAPLIEGKVSINLPDSAYDFQQPIR